MPNYGIGLGIGLGLRVSKSLLPKGPAYLPGVVQSIYDGYFSDDVSFFSTATRSSSAIITSLNEGVPSFTSYQILGYFRPATSEEYTLYLNTDDAGYFWIGENAITGFTTENANINVGGLHGPFEVSTTIELIAGVYYPIRIQSGNNEGGGFAGFNYSTPTIEKTTDLTTVGFYNPATNGF
jgi:hypothetical protein